MTSTVVETKQVTKQNSGGKCLEGYLDSMPESLSEEVIFKLNDEWQERGGYAKT